MSLGWEVAAPEEEEEMAEKKRMLAGWLAGAAAAIEREKEMKGKERKRGKGKVASWRNASVSSVAAAGLSKGTLIHN